MELFGVSPIELLFIAILGLIIFGPERLPEIGRFLGRSVARVLAWQYTSPEAQMLNELRRDFEQQILEIRDEMVYAREQLDVRAELAEVQRETEALIRGDIPPKTVSTTDSASDSVSAAPPVAEAEPTIAPPAPPAPPPDLSVSVPSAPIAIPEPAPPAVATQHEGGHSEIEALTQQIQLLSATVHALQEQLRQRGLLDPEWQPPLERVHEEQVVS